jgi:hypothetical protein
MGRSAMRLCLLGLLGAVIAGCTQTTPPGEPSPPTASLRIQVAALCALPAVGHVDDEPFVSPSVVSGFTFTSLGGDPIYQQERAGLGLRFSDPGLEVVFPRPSGFAILTLVALAQPIEVTAIDSAGTALATFKVPNTGSAAKSIYVPGPDLATIRLTGGNNEPVVFSVCVDGD